MAMLSANLVDRVGEIISRYSMLSAGDRVGAGVSGGADSVALLHILQRLKFRVTVLHVNHQLRGPESDADESFVRALADSLGLEVVVEQAPIQHGNLEQEARLARRRFFKRCLESHGFNKVALGHTRSDQAETVLFRFLRGSGLAGLAGMRMVTTHGLIRPLLTTSREDVRSWAAAEGIEWREDSSNADLRFKRNRLRNEVIPALAHEFNPNLEAVLSGTAELAGDEEDYWTEQVEAIYRQITKRTPICAHNEHQTPCGLHLGSFFQISALLNLHVAVQRRVIRRALIDVRGDLRSIDMRHVDAILAICGSRHGHDRVIVPGVDAFRSFDTLLLAPVGELNSTPRHYQLELKLEENLELPFRVGRIIVSRARTGPQNCVNFKKEQQFPVEVVDLDGEALTAEGVALRVRNWEPGDELHRPGHQGAEKVKSLFQEHKVLLWERRDWPVVVAGDEIVWVRRFGAAAKFSAVSVGRESIRLSYYAAAE
jgi:tRNA(Ile)-lysidine synthase